MVLLVLAASLGSALDARPLALTDYLQWETVADPQVSPDGGQVVFTRTRVDPVKDRFASELWIMDADGSHSRRLLDNASAARFSPSGDRLVFIRPDQDDKPQLFVHWLDPAGATTQVTRDARMPSAPAWSPDGEQIAFRALVPMQPELSITLPARPEGAKWTEDPQVIERAHYRADRVGPKTGFTHLFVVPADGGSPRQVTSGKWDVGARMAGIDFGDGPRWLPDGAGLVFSGAADEARADHGRRSDINVVDLEGGAVTRLSSAEGLWAAPAVSPDGRLIAYTGSTAEASNFPPNEIRVMNRDGSGDRLLLGDLGSRVGDLRWAANGRSLYFTMDREGSNNVHRLALDGSMQDVTIGAQRLSLTSASGTAGYGVITAAHTTPNLARIDLKQGRIRQQTDVNADLLHDVSLGSVEEIWYDSSDETRVQGWIVKPPDFDPARRYPLILEIHGGPNAMYGVDFNFRFQQLAAQGYVLLYTNPRGSTGYGYEFVDAIDHAYPGRRDYDDLMAGVDAVLARGYVDETRLYVTGCSGGGALTAWIVTHTDRFAAAAALCPVTNWITMAGNADITRWTMERFQAPFWEDPTSWIEHSPIFRVGKVTTPTLLMTGTRDLRTPLAQAEEFYQALKHRGVPTVLIAMNDEWHGTWSVPSNMLRTQLYLQAWFERYPSTPTDAGDG